MYAQAVALRDRLRDSDVVDVKAYTDVSKAATNRPCVLVPPPTINWQTRSATWQLVALTGHPSGSEAAWCELDDLVRDVAKVLDVEQARPAAYVLTDRQPPVAAFLITLTTSH